MLHFASHICSSKPAASSAAPRPHVSLSLGFLFLLFVWGRRRGDGGAEKETHKYREDRAPLPLTSATFCLLAVDVRFLTVAERT